MRSTWNAEGLKESPYFCPSCGKRLRVLLPTQRDACAEAVLVCLGLWKSFQYLGGGMKMISWREYGIRAWKDNKAEGCYS